jgi:phosphoglycerol transferase MdoB-like AlkP superfamily enzyme
MQINAFRRYWPVYALAGLYLILGLGTRIVLWSAFGADAAVGVGAVPPILAAGLVNDLVQCLYLLAPLALYILMLPDRWYRTRANDILLLAGSVVVLAVLIYLSVVEYYFFEEFDARFNVVAVDYLMYPAEVVGDIWEAYPVVRSLLAAVLLAAVLTWRLRPALRASAEPRVRWHARLRPALMHAVALALAVGFYATDTLAWSANRVTNELLQNGYSSFFRAAVTNDIDYGAYYATRPSADNLNTLRAYLAAGGGRFTRLDEGRIDRAFGARPGGFGRMNVVVVVGESFGAEFSKLYGSPRDLTPEFDRYARQGLWFAHTYASGTRTVRGLEALTASFPPIPTVSIVRRPGNEHIATWGKVMSGLGYHTSFLYGGYAYFDNMSHFYGQNGFEVVDRGAVARPRFANIWGVSDEDLFDLALQRLGAEHAAGQPFFSMIMTTSNHKPFTFRAGLEAQGIPVSGGGRAAGVRYADYALGRFLRAAAHQPWFDNTLFVVVADHGARVYGKQQIPLKTYEIPLMIYAPARLAPRRVDTLMTQIDVAPTVLGLLGLPYEAPFLGQDVLHHPDAPRLALFNHNHDVAILQGDALVVYGLHKQVQSFHYTRATDAYDTAPRDRRLEELGVAMFQVGSELFRDHRYD